MPDVIAPEFVDEDDVQDALDLAQRLALLLRREPTTPPVGNPNLALEPDRGAA